MQNLINKFKHLPDDRIGDGIFIAFEWTTNQQGERVLVRIYLGSKAAGPMLQWFRPTIIDDQNNGYTLTVMGVSTLIKPWQLYNGYDWVDFYGGAWTNLYSRGNFGKKYAFGGNWSGHNKNLHPRLMLSPVKDEKSEILLTDQGDIIPLPDGIKGEVGVTDVDCSGSWSIWYNSAAEALANRLTTDEIQGSKLPNITKMHLLKNETVSVIDALNDVIETYDL